MAEKVAIKITNVNVNPHTGYITIHVQTTTSTDNATWSGPVRGYGMDAMMYAQRFNRDMGQVKAWIREQHQQYVGHHLELTEKIQSLVGEEI